MASPALTGETDPGRLGHEAVLFFCQHLVALRASFDRPDGTGGSELFSGFILEVRGRWFFVTAGHALQDLYASLPLCKNVACELHDSWHPRASPTPIPFDLLGARHFEIDDDGLDVGVVEIGSFHRRMLQANHIRAFSEVAWRDPPAEMVTYSVLGLPDQFTTRLDERGSTMHVRPTMLNLKKVPPPPQMEKQAPCFYGKIPERIVYPATGEPLEEMVGFSGGPILGFRRDEDTGQMNYFVIAVQSVWRRDLRVVRGPLVSMIGEALEQLLTS